MKDRLRLDPDRLFPAEPEVRAIARRLFRDIEGLPIVSPHGHCDPRWFATDEAFSDPSKLLITPDHYVFRMLHSQGVPLEALGVPRADGGPIETDTRAIWRLFAKNYHLFRGTPSRMWLDWIFVELFGMTVRLSAATADTYYDRIAEALVTPDFRPRRLMERLNIEVMTTTESPLDPLDHHRVIRESGWPGRVLTTFRPDPVVDPEFEGFQSNLDRLAALTGEDTRKWSGYLGALRQRRAAFRAMGATSTDHGHPTALTADLHYPEAEVLFARVVHGTFTSADAELFRAQMLTEMARMSVEDGMVMQLHPGSYRNHDAPTFAMFGRDKGADIPMRTDYVHGLKPLLDRFGSAEGFTFIIFTLDESVYSRELAPLAGHYPCLRLGPPWWFHDSSEGMRRFREQTTETAGFYNMVGFNDDTRAFLSIPARHDVARRMDCNFLARLVSEHRLEDDEAVELASDLTYGLVKRTYKL